MPKTTPSREAAPEAPVPHRTALLALLLAWAVPGAGHFLLGHRRRAAFFLLLIGVCIVLGTRLDGKLYTSFQSGLPEAAAAAGCMGMGAAYVVLRFVLDYSGEVAALGYEYGGAFLLTAGLMNFLLVIDCWDIASGRKE